MYLLTYNNIPNTVGTDKAYKQHCVEKSALKGLVIRLFV